MYSISCRNPHDKRCYVEPTPNPFPEVYRQCESDEEGNLKFTPSDPVMPSRADDFSVVNNAMYRGLMHGVSVRLLSDPVDFEQKVSDLISE